MIISHLLVFFLGLFYLGSCVEYKLADGCPLSQDAWTNRAAQFSCSKSRGLFYHCFRTQNDSMIEICQSLQFFSNSELKGQCPFILVDSGKHHFEYETCQSDAKSRCPKANESFSSNQLYLYDGCLVPRKINNKTHDVMTTTLWNSSDSGMVFLTKLSTNNVTDYERRTKESHDESCKKEHVYQKDPRCYTVTYVVAVVMSVLVCLAVASAVYFYRRTKYYQEKLENVAYVNMTVDTEDDQTPKPHDYGRIYNEIRENSSSVGSVSSGYETPNNRSGNPVRTTQGQSQTNNEGRCPE